MHKRILLSFAVIVSGLSINSQTVTDYDGNVYNTLVINNKVWMKENLKTKHYQNGDSIGTTYPATKNISAENAPKYQWAYNGTESNVAVYGRMYTFYAITDSRNLCPVGWHAATEAEWRDMSLFLGGDSVSGQKLKETGTSHWIAPNLASNTSGFTALPGGIRFGYGTFSSFTNTAAFWTSSEYSPTYGIYRRMVNTDTLLYRGSGLKNNGYSVRCVSNTPPTGMNENQLKKEINIYPNPSREQIHISTAESFSEITIYSLLGEKIFVTAIKPGLTTIDISPIAKGMYVLILSGKEGMHREMFVKE